MLKKIVEIICVIFIITITISCSNNDKLFITIDGEKVLRKDIKMEIYTLDSINRFGGETTTPNELLKYFDYKTLVNNGLLRTYSNEILNIINYKDLKINSNEYTYDDYVLRCNLINRYKILYSFAINIDKKKIWINNNHYIIDDNKDFIYILPISLPSFYRYNQIKSQ